MTYDNRVRLHGFTCPDCGQRILSYSWDDEDQRCASCDWIRKNVPPNQQTDARERLACRSPSR